MSSDPADDAREKQQLEEEQRRLDRARECLVAMQNRAAEVREVSDRAVAQENTPDARIAQFHLKRREAALREVRGPLCFGRIDTDDGDRWYVGRRHVEDENARPVVVDWRAPVSAPFYRATAVDPCGLEFRRRFVLEGDTLVALLDERLDDPDDEGAHGGLPDPLLAELERSRTGQMRDIVATIAAEQDVIIRAPLEELLVVQGGPGTGKTAVGLHRAAFLLFEHRETLIDQKVLVVGPNPLFLRYISEVLPSLGETAVTQTTLTGLVAARHRVRGTDTDQVARIKGRGGMRHVISSAVRRRIKPAADGLEVRVGLAVVRFDEAELEQLQKTAMARRLPLNQSRDVFRQMVMQEAWRRHSGRPGVDPGGQPLFLSELRRDPGFKSAIDKMWPNLSAVSVVRSLLGTPRWMSDAAAGILTDEEQRLLRRRPAKKPADEPWTAADIPLLDEAEHLISGVAASYGHVVVDEAQDLSEMALRMLARRASRGSMTVLGDLAQATSPDAAGSWDAAIEAMTGHLAELSADGTVPTVRQTELTVGYRVPAAILDVANQLLEQAAPDVTPARSVRAGGDPPLVLAVDAEDLAATVASEVTALRNRTSSVAVVGLDRQLDRLAAELEARGIAADRVGGAGLPGESAVALVSPAAVKGLEFDAVVVVEPTEITALDAGLRHLYVAMSRPVQHLGIVHTGGLPPQLSLPA